MSSRREPEHPSKGEDGSSTLESRQSPSPSLSSQATQGVHNSHFSGSSRTHIGNVYNNNNNNTYTNASLPSPRNRSQDLMDALEFDGMEDRLLAVTPAFGNTCSWFLETQEYIKWRDSACRTSHNGVLWIKGNAGTGKSTLMRYVLDHACRNSQDSVTLAFFFDGRSPNTLAKSTEGMYRSLLHQIYEHIPRLKIAATRRFPTTKRLHWSSNVLAGLFREAIRGLKVDEYVTCYIDALDECVTNQVRLAVECFEDLSQSAIRDGVPFSICFASRYYPRITMQTYLEAKLDLMTQHSHDILEYLNKRLTIPPAMKSALQEEIEMRCSGTFLWVVLVVRMLNENSDKGATQMQLYALLKSLPGELSALFANISQSAGPDFGVAMRWVLFCERSLSPQELYFAIGTGTRTLDSAYWDRHEVSRISIQSYILHVSRGLIECVGLAKRVQFVHETVREYLLSGNLENMKSLSRQDLVKLSHVKMAKDCEHYLELCIHGQRNILDIEGQNKGNLYPLSRYALEYVFKHIKFAYRQGSSDLSLLEFSALDYLAVLQYFELYGESQSHETYVPEHSAIMLMVLIATEHFALAEHILKSMSRSENTKGTPWAPDLTTCCGGRWGSPLHAAIGYRNVGLVRLLLEHGASPNPSQEKCKEMDGSSYDSPIMLAVKHGTVDELRLVLDYGADANFTSHSWEHTPLLRACMIDAPDRLAKVKLLLSKGADVDVSTDEGLTALHLVIRYGSRDTGHILRELLEAGANVNSVDMYDKTPLIMAVYLCEFRTIMVLLDYGANAEYRSTTSGTAVAAARESILRPLLLFMRLRALKGRDAFLQLAARPPMRDERHPSRLPSPVRPRSRRREIPLQYRHPPRRRPWFDYYPKRHDTDPERDEAGTHSEVESYYWTDSGSGRHGSNYSD